MIKRLDKKAQNMSIGTLVGLALAIIVLVFVVLGFTRGWGYIFNKTDYLPSDLETHAQACKQYQEQDIKISYCAYKENKLSEGDVYMNCKGVYKKVEDLVGSVEFEDSIDCGILPKNYCANQELDDSDKIYDTLKEKVVKCEDVISG